MTDFKIYKFIRDKEHNDNVWIGLIDEMVSDDLNGGFHYHFTGVIISKKHGRFYASGLDAYADSSIYKINELHIRKIKSKAVRQYLESGRWLLDLNTDKWNKI